MSKSKVSKSKQPRKAVQLQGCVAALLVFLYDLALC